MKNVERNKQIVDLVVKDGKNLKEIGAQFSISRERVRQILESAQIKASELKLERLKEEVTTKMSSAPIKTLTGDKTVNRYLKRTEGITVAEKLKREQGVKCLALHEQGKKASEIAKELNIHRSTVYSLLNNMSVNLTPVNRKERNEKIKKLVSEGKTQAEVANQFGLTTTQVANIIKDRKTPYNPERYKKYKSRLDELNNTKHV